MVMKELMNKLDEIRYKKKGKLKAGVLTKYKARGWTQKRRIYKPLKNW